MGRPTCDSVEEVVVEALLGIHGAGAVDDLGAREGMCWELGLRFHDTGQYGSRLLYTSSRQMQ